MPTLTQFESTTIWGDFVIGNRVGLEARLALLAASIGVLVGVLLSAPRAEAASLQVLHYPAQQHTGLFDYGWHFDETGNSFGARDYNYSGDGSSDWETLRVKLDQTQTYAIRWKITPRTCGVTAVQQQNTTGSTWITNGGTEMHFLHMQDSTRITTTSGTDPYYTTSIKNAAATLSVNLGQQGLCGTTAYHTHHSADLSSTSFLFRVIYPGDTCWVDSDTWHCPSTYRDHLTCTSGTTTTGFTKSGNFTEYFCETWSNQSQSKDNAAFHLIW